MKHFTSLLMAAAMSLSLVTAASAYTVIPLDQEDLLSPELIESELGSEWARDELELAGQAGLKTIHTMVGMKDQITRFQFAELAVNLAEVMTGKEIEAAAADTFDDCTETAVLKAYTAGIVDGVSETSFAPDKTTNREQIATMIARTIQYINTAMEVELAPAAADLSKFADRDTVSAWARDGVGLLAANGIMGGTSADTLSPKNPCTVEQSILLVYRVFTKG